MKSAKKNKSIIYVNFSPYENAGSILDFLKKKFTTVLLFSLQFHKISGNRYSDMFIIFHKGKIVKRYKLFHAPVITALTFFLIPFRSVIIFLQIVIYVLMVRKKYGPYYIYFTVNAYPAWIGNVLKKFRVVNETIFWVWDYYPPHDKNKIVMFMRWLYWHFDKLATHSDRLIFLNHRLENLRKKIGIIPASKHFPIIGIGTNIVHIKRKASDSLLFIGVLKCTQGLELLIHNSRQLHNLYPKLKIHVIGTGPDERYLKEIAKQSAVPVFFHGIQNIFSTKTKNIIKNTSIGIAPYKPEPGNVSYYGDPSKIKNYIGYGLPVITTNVFEFAQEIQKSQAGIVIPYDINSFILALNAINKNYVRYTANAYKLAKKYDYKTNYANMFD